MTTRTPKAITPDTPSAQESAPDPTEPAPLYSVGSVSGFSDDAWVGACHSCPTTTKRMGSERKATRSIRAHVAAVHL